VKLPGNPVVLTKTVYVCTGVPPSFGQTTLFQLSVICSPAVDAETTESTGASGFVSMIAPLFGAEKAEVPLMFCADTFTNTLEPHGNSNGIALRFEIGTVHVCCVRSVR